MGRGALFFLGTSLVAAAALVVATVAGARPPDAVGVVAPLVLATLAADLALPAVLLLRGPAGARPFAWGAAGALAGLLVATLALYRPGEAQRVPLEIVLLFLLYATPTLSALLGAGGARPGALAVALVGAVGMALVYVAALRFGALTFEPSTSAGLHAALILFVLAGALATFAALRLTRRRA